MSKKVYMHTINGKPGYFNGYQICYLPKSRAKNVLRMELETIFLERLASNRYREKQGYSDSSEDYGHVMFYINTPSN